MENNIKEINEVKLQQSLEKVFAIFKDNINKYSNKNNIKFEEISKNSLKNLNKILNLLAEEDNKEEEIKETLEEFSEEMTDFDELEEENQDINIKNNYKIINHFYNIIEDFNEKFSTESFEDFFSFLQNNSEKTSIFDPLELEIENNNKEDEIHFIYTNKNTIEYSSISFEEDELKNIWKLFVKNTYAESKKVLKNLKNDTEVKSIEENKNITVKKSNFKKLIETFSKKPRSLSCWIL